MPRIKSKASGVTIEDEAIVETPVTNTDEVAETSESVESESLEAMDDFEDEVDINMDLVQKSPVKLVKILPKTNHTCVIGGVRYTLKKGVQQNVPLDVKSILTKADLLLPL